MLDLEFKKTLAELGDILKKDVMNKVDSHVFSLQRRNEQVTESREKWKARALEAEEKLKDYEKKEQTKMSNLQGKK